MLRKLLPNLLIFFLFLGAFPSQAGAGGGFSDVNEGMWHYDSIMNLWGIGIVDGFPNGSFKPNEPLDADQFIKMIVLALGHELENGTDYWASTYIKCAGDAGLLDMYEGPDFTKPLTRGEMACILSRALDLKAEEIVIDSCGLYDLYGYTPEEYLHDVLKVYNSGIITGYPDGTFRYNTNMTRAEACAVINKLVTPITRRERNITSLTPVPVCYSFIQDDIERYINTYDGNYGCLVEGGAFACGDSVVCESHNPDIHTDIINTLKLMLDERCFISIKCMKPGDKNIVEISCFNDKAYSGDSRYSMFSIMFYDAPTGYPEKELGYDSMQFKLDINRLSDKGLLNPDTNLPDVYYEYRVRSLMRLLFGRKTGDVLSEAIISRYVEYSGYPAGEIPLTVELISHGNVEMVFFSRGGSRQLSFSFTEDHDE